MKLEIPTPKLVKEYNERFKKDERYYLADQAIILLFDKFRGNGDIKTILLKVSVINDLYSTNVFATFKMAQHILSLDIDPGLRKGDVSLVNRIAKVRISNREKNFYSFATKYCNWHNPSKFPIFDSFVGDILKLYRKQTGFYQFRNDDLRDYAEFLKILEEFRNHFGLNEFDFKEIDKFLWTYGKEVFKR